MAATRFEPRLFLSDSTGVFGKVKWVMLLVRNASGQGLYVKISTIILNSVMLINMPAHIYSDHFCGGWLCSRSSEQETCPSGYLASMPILASTEQAVQ